MGGYLSDLRDWSPLFLQGLVVTVGVSVATMTLATALGFLLALMRNLPTTGLLLLLPPLIRCYVDLFRGLPIIVTLFIIYFGLPVVGLEISSNPIIAGTVGLTLKLSAYLCEVFRAALAAVDPGQMEAARALGMSLTQAYRRIVAPQALLVAVPTLGGYFIGLLKDTSLLGFISVTELMRSAVMLVSDSFKPFEIYMTVGAIYLVLSLIASHFVSRIERGYGRWRRPIRARKRPRWRRSFRCDRRLPNRRASGRSSQCGDPEGRGAWCMQGVRRHARARQRLAIGRSRRDRRHHRAERRGQEHAAPVHQPPDRF